MNHALSCAAKSLNLKHIPQKCAKTVPKVALEVTSIDAVDKL